MLFTTIAEYDAEMAEVREVLKAAMKIQASTSGGPGQGQHTQRGNVREIREYLELLGKERDVLAARSGGGNVNLVEFGRES
jgi:hypothetical protein